MLPINHLSVLSLLCQWTRWAGLTESDFRPRHLICFSHCWKMSPYNGLVIHDIFTDASGLDSEIVNLQEDM